MSSPGLFIVKAGYLDVLAQKDSVIHRLDPRVKLLTTLLFIVTVVSFDKYHLSALLPFGVFPIVLIVLGGLPAGYILNRVLWIWPFAILIGIFNPLLDRQVLLHLGSLDISGGWVSFISIQVRFFLTVSAAFVLVAATGFNTLCLAFNKLGVPSIFVIQLLFLYRYTFVLADEAGRMVRAWQLRTPLRKAMTVNTFTLVLGSLFLRAVARAERIYQAMCCRCFDGTFHPAYRLKWKMADSLFLIACILFLVFFRFMRPVTWLGEFVTGMFS